jgi:hypothetical protein
MGASLGRCASVSWPHVGFFDALPRDDPPRPLADVLHKPQSSIASDRRWQQSSHRDEFWPHDWYTNSQRAEGIGLTSCGGGEHNRTSDDHLRVRFVVPSDFRPVSAIYVIHDHDSVSQGGLLKQEVLWQQAVRAAEKAHCFPSCKGSMSKA